MTVRTLSELAELCRAELIGDGAREVTGPARLDMAGPSEISFLAQPRYRPQLGTTRAAAVVVARDIEPDTARGAEGPALLRCDDPEVAFNEVVLAFAPEVPAPPVGVHALAVVEAGAAVDPTASIGPFCRVGEGARIGAGAVLHERVSVGAGAVVGEASVLHPGVTLYPHTRLGRDCTVHAGTVIGSDGFGFRHTRDGWVKTPQAGHVVVEDRVEIGANAAIDCGRFGPTRIGAGTKIDNQVHVAHNVDVGEDCLLIAQAGIAGSTRLGRGVIVAGQAGISGHLEIGPGARIGGGAGVVHDLPGGTDWFGYPAKPRVTTMRLSKEMDRLPELRKRVRELERRLAELSGDADGANGAGDTEGAGA